MKFSQPYKLFITRRLNDTIADDELTAKAVYEACRRFAAGDWGELCQEDKQQNDIDLRDRDGHVLGRYHTPTGDIYINLTFDEPSIQSDVATVMYCDEY